MLEKQEQLESEHWAARIPPTLHQLSRPEIICLQVETKAPPTAIPSDQEHKVAPTAPALPLASFNYKGLNFLLNQTHKTALVLLEHRIPRRESARNGLGTGEGQKRLSLLGVIPFESHNHHHL